MNKHRSIHTNSRFPEWLTRFAPGILLGIYVVLFFLVKNPGNPHDRVIISDGKAYYGYLTGFLIYQDLSYGFVEDYESRYYPDHPSIFKEFRFTFRGETVNKGFPGLAFLLLPFFLIAHIIALISGLPADGYSLIYQYAMGFAALFYFWLGLVFTKKLLLSFGFSSKVSTGILILIAFATNIIYYTLKEGMMTHVYNFWLVAAFLFYVKTYVRSGFVKHIAAAALLFGLIVSVRPTNGMFILLVPFAAGSADGLMTMLRKIFLRPGTLVPVILAGMIFPLLTMFIWYLHSGYWLVWSYGDEGFNFLEPNFFKILFSFNRGWFIYTPVAFLSLTGLIWLFRNERFRFWWAAAFLVIFVYVASSWWVWTYTSNFGQRTFIDTYPFIALMLGYTWRAISFKKMLRALAIVLSVLLIAINSLQFYQHYTYVFPPNALTFDIYKQVFWRLKPKPKVFYPEGYIVSRKVFYNDFEDDYGWLNYGSVTGEKSFEGEYASQTGISGNYSIGLHENIRPYLTTDYNRVRVSAMIYTDQRESSAILIIDLEADGKSLHYQAFAMDRFSRKNRWAYVEVATEIPDKSTGVNTLRVYFLNKDAGEQFYIDNLKVEVLSLSVDY